MIRITNRLQKDVVVADGAMGTLLLDSIKRVEQAVEVAKSKQPGRKFKETKKIADKPLELLNISNPDLITKVHRNYVAAGAEVVYTNTLCANRVNLERHKVSVDEVVRAGVLCAKKSGASYVALDIGQIGKDIEPNGTTSFEEAVSMYKEIIEAGQGADLIVLETMVDLAHARAAVIAAKDITEKPVILTMSFNEDGRTYTGVDVETMAITFSGMGLDAIGINCSPEPKVLKNLVERIAAVSNLPIVLKPGAGLPDAEGNYKVGPEEFAKCLVELLPLGVRMVGGCCGTTPEHIMKLAVEVGNFKKYAMTVGWHMAIPKREREVACICSGKKWLDISYFKVIGKLINKDNKERILDALSIGNLDYIGVKALEQRSAGAEILCINAIDGDIDNPEDIVKVINAIQVDNDIPLMVETIRPETARAALRSYNGKMIISYATPEDSVIKDILPIAARYGATVVGLATVNDAIRTASATYTYGELIFRQALKYGIPRENIIIDCKVDSLDQDPESPMNTLEAMQRIRLELGVKTSLNVDNVSDFNSDNGKLSASFLTMALCYGLALPIINTKNREAMEAVECFRKITNRQ